MSVATGSNCEAEQRRPSNTALAALAQAVSPDVVISEVYGGGGNSGATLKQDFIELHNRGASEASVEGWSVQYASSSGTTWQVTERPV